VSLLAMAARQPTQSPVDVLNPCGSWLASEDGLTANQSPLDVLNL
jgi:hypothetical protein